MNTVSDDSDSLSDGSLGREAAAWLSLLSSGRATEADAARLKEWRERTPDHARAYAEATRAWRLMAPAAEALRRQAPGQDVRAPDAPKGQARPRALARRALIGGGAIAAGAGAIYLAARPPLALWPSLAELAGDYRTGAGEQRRITAIEDVAIELNTRSSITLGASGGTDQIVLIAGEAVVGAGAGTSNRVCVVTAGGGRTRLRRATADIRHDGESVWVTCLQGTAEIEHGGRSLSLQADQQAAYNARGLSGSRTIDPAIVMAWQDGRLVFRGETLARAIAEINRYRRGRIILLDEALGRHVIDASFRLDRLDTAIAYFQQAFDARVTALPGGILLLG